MGSCNEEIKRPILLFEKDGIINNQGCITIGYIIGLLLVYCQCYCQPFGKPITNHPKYTKSGVDERRRAYGCPLANWLAGKDAPFRGIPFVRLVKGLVKDRGAAAVFV